MTKRVEAVICSKVTVLSRFTKKCLLLQLLWEGYNYNERDGIKRRKKVSHISETAVAQI